MMSKGYFIFEKEKCVGCEACVVACMNENGIQESETWRNVHSSNPGNHPGIPLFHLSISCNHCEKAVCMDHCPSLAYTRSSYTGAVLHDADKCIGCKYCIWNCPYEAPKYDPYNGVISKCNLCESRLQEGKKPACASLCPTGALDFKFEKIKHSDHESTLAVPVQTKPSLFIKEPVKESTPRMDRSLFETVDPDLVNKKKRSGISASKEWTLVLFTLIVSLMVAVTAMDVLKFQTPVNKIVFLSLGAIIGGLSMLHLGRPSRAYRAILNIKGSWLSREILFFTLFYAITCIDLIIMDLPNWTVLLPGFLLLLSIDMLYRPVQTHWKNKIHSAETIFIALSLFLLSTKSFWLFGLIMIIRLYLYISINLNFMKLGGRSFTVSKIIRMLFILLTFLSISLHFPYWVSILIFVPGEIIDRILFYNDLALPDLKKVLVSGNSKRENI